MDSSLPTKSFVFVEGAFAALTVSMFGSMFPMPRIAYAMAKDGLLFKFLARVNSRGVPAWANLWLGLISAFCALIFSLEVMKKFDLTCLSSSEHVDVELGNL